MKELLQSIKEQLFDAPSDVKSAFNDIVEYFDGIEVNLPAFFDAIEDKVKESIDKSASRKDRYGRSMHTYSSSFSWIPIEVLDKLGIEYKNFVHKGKGKGYLLGPYDKTFVVMEAIKSGKVTADDIVNAYREYKSNKEDRAAQVKQQKADKLKSYETKATGELDKLEEKYVPEGGSASTKGGEILRARQYLLYRYYNDGDTP